VMSITSTIFQFSENLLTIPTQNITSNLIPKLEIQCLLLVKVGAKWKQLLPAQLF
jgi:hypothetical protein